jgi:hypothetical protein
MALDQQAGGSAHRFRKTLGAATAAASLMLGATAGPAAAQTSGSDGNSPVGSWRWQFEPTLYPWFLAIDTHLDLGPTGAISGKNTTPVTRVGALPDVSNPRRVKLCSRTETGC